MPQTEGNRVVEEFQLRRKKMLQNFVFCMILLALALTIKQLSDQATDFLGMNDAFWSALALAQLIAAIVFGLVGFLQYRCPVCDEIVKGHDKYYLGVIINPSQCPKCGARLSE